MPLAFGFGNELELNLVTTPKTLHVFGKSRRNLNHPNVKGNQTVFEKRRLYTTCQPITKALDWLKIIAHRKVQIDGPSPRRAISNINSIAALQDKFLH